jgi:hypothetical protein
VTSSTETREDPPRWPPDMAVGLSRRETAVWLVVGIVVGALMLLPLGIGLYAARMIGSD